jgi:hypothetical protein
VAVITFKSCGRYINPSRAAPHSVKTAAVPESKVASRYAVLANSTTNNSYAIFTSVIIVSSANLVFPLSPFKSVSGLLCCQEWERFTAFFCQVFRQKTLTAQINEDAISFTTRMRPKAVDTGTFKYSFASS